MFRVQGHDDGTGLTKVVNGKEVRISAKQDRHARSRRDLSVHQVENLKDALQKHLREIKKLRAIRFGKDGAQVNQDLAASDIDSESSSDDELNNNIARVKKLIDNAKAVLRGEGEEEIQIFTNDTSLVDQVNQSE